MLQTIKNKAHFILYAFAVMVTVYPKMLGMFVILSLIGVLLVGIDFENGKKRLVDFKTALPWMLMFFIMHFIGLWNTENVSFAWMDIGMKMSFGLLPLAFAFGKWKTDFKSLFDFFLIGAILSVIIALIIGTIHYVSIREYHVFTNSYVAYSMHRSYWATYLVIAFAYAFYRIITQSELKVQLLSGMLILLLGIALSGSKAGLLLLVSVFVSMIIYSIIRFRQWKMGSALILIFLLCSWLLLKFVPTIKVRFELMFSESTKDAPKNFDSTESTSARIFLWESSMELIRENPVFGVGTGDIKDVLKQRNIDKGFTGVARENMNAHNQFFNTQLALGIGGTVALLGMFFAPLFYQKGSEKFFIRIVLFIFVFSLIPESFLETQAGIIPIAFFLSFFGYCSNSNDKITTFKSTIPNSKSN